MLDTGAYRISYYNKYGALLKNLKHKGTSYLETKDLAEKFLIKKASKFKKKGGDDKDVPASFTLDRRIYNSLDKEEKF